METEQPRHPRPWLHRYAVATAASTLFLIVAGALVTSNDAGLSVPDWPLSYGQIMPPMHGGIFYEHGHRMVATAVGLLTIGLAVGLWRAEPRRWLRRLGWIALAAVVVQGVLGGLTVLFLLPWYISISHAALAQSFFCLVVSIAVFTSAGWQPVSKKSAPDGPPALPTLAAWTTAAVFLQLLLGAAFRHRALGISPHVLWAPVVTLLAIWTIRRIRAGGAQALQGPGMALGAGIVLQITLGVAAYLGRLATAEAPQPIPWVVWTTVAHVAVGAFVLAACVVLTLHAYRLFERGAAASAWTPTTQESNG